MTLLCIDGCVVARWVLAPQNSAIRRSSDSAKAALRSIPTGTLVDASLLRSFLYRVT